MSNIRPVQLPDAYPASRSNSSPSGSNSIAIPHVRPSVNIPMDIPNRTDSDAFRMRYYQTLAAGGRRHSAYPPAKVNAMNDPMSSKPSDSNPYGSRSFPSLSKSAPVEVGINVQRSAPINIPAQRQSARGWAYAYARNSNYNHLNQLASDEVKKFGFNSSLLDDDQDTFNQSKPELDDNEDDLIDSFSNSKALSSDLYNNHFPFTHSVDFEL